MGLLRLCFSVGILLTIILLFQGCGHERQNRFELTQMKGAFEIATDNYILTIREKGFRFGLRCHDGRIIAPEHPISGIQVGSDTISMNDIVSSQLTEQKNDHLVFEAGTDSGIEMVIRIWPEERWIKMQATPGEASEYAVLARTAGISPAFGLADYASGMFGMPGGKSTDVTGLAYDNMTAWKYRTRMLNNFVIFPKHNFASVNVDPAQKIVRVTNEEHAQGTSKGKGISALYYFIGAPKEIYQSLRQVRELEGQPLMKPKYGFFGVGWEAFGALGLNTNEKTVRDNIEKYLELGYPLEWMVIGSGFWPDDRPGLEATTSFGLWNANRYPQPYEMIRDFHNMGLKVMLGLRIAFTADGPYAEEGVENAYFIKNPNGQPRIFRTAIPKGDVYLLNAQNTDAVNWYVDLCKKWIDCGVDGFKEDLMGRPFDLNDNLIDPVNQALMQQGVYVMGRNMYFGSPADIHRIEDFNLHMNQDRGPINGLALAYSGFPFVYPDIVGGFGIQSKRYSNISGEVKAQYLMRFAQYAALNSTMAFGYGPWNFEEENKEVVAVTLQAARLHDRIQPYLYSAAIKTYHTGYPYTMTPLPLAYPEDPEVYKLDNDTRRGYQWLIDESLLAVPVYGDDYATADSRDVYLPAGKWMDYDTGQPYQGPATLKNFSIPVDKTPLFVGGKGIVVEERDGKLTGRIYPVVDEASTEFIDRDGETKSRITINKPDWEKPVVTDESTGEVISGEWVHHAYQFMLTPGHDYIIN